MERMETSQKAEPSSALAGEVERISNCHETGGLTTSSRYALYMYNGTMGVVRSKERGEWANFIRESVTKSEKKFSW
jgi:hypothetical protein